MRSCLGRNTASAATPAYGFDLEIELFKSASASIKASPHSSSSSSSTTSPSLSSCFTSSSPDSVSQSSSSLSPALSICTRKSRAPRKRPNQTYNEAAALLSSALPNVFSPTQLAKPSSFKFAKHIDSNGCLDSAIGEELLLPLSLPEKPLESRLGSFSSSCCCITYSDSSSEKPCQIPVEDNVIREDHGFDAESILDEEIGGGIDSIIGNLTMRSENGVQNQQQEAGNFSYGIPMGLGFLRGRFDYGYGVNKGVRAFRNSSEYGGYGDWWWRFSTLTTVDVGAISPMLQKKPEVNDKKKKVPEEKERGGTTITPTEREERQAANCSDHQIQLKLDYDGVLSKWSDRGSPFSDEETRLGQIDLFGESGEVREANVQRYKEKGRTRLFSNKIRYHLRKLNADQRPRIKGRFVRRSPSSQT